MADSGHITRRSAIKGGAAAFLTFSFGAGLTFDPADYVRDVERAGHWLYVGLHDGKVVSLYDSYPPEPETGYALALYNEARRRYGRNIETNKTTLVEYLIGIGRVVHL